MHSNHRVINANRNDINELLLLYCIHPVLTPFSESFEVITIPELFGLHVLPGLKEKHPYALSDIKTNLKVQITHLTALSIL